MADGTTAGGPGRARRRVASTVAAALACAGLAACGSSGPKPDATVVAFLTAWGRMDTTAMARLVDHPPADFAATYQSVSTDLGVTAAVHDAAPAVTHGSAATAALTSRLTVAGYGPLTLHSTLSLQKVSGHWLIEWSPRAIADQLATGDRFSVTRSWPARAPVLGAGGASLTPAGVDVGLVGSRITDAAQLRAILIAAHFPAATVDAALAAAAAHPTELEPVGTLSLATYQALKAMPGTTLYSIGGTTFTHGGQAPLTADLATHVLGSVGPITADELHTLGPLYRSTDSVGQSGIESVYERQLAGSPSTTVKVLSAAGATVATLGSVPAVAGQPVTTSIDPVVQAAAEHALDGIDPTKQAAIVVERASTGEVLASVSRPLAPFDIALDGQLPPGSTFKVATVTALLLHGATPATQTTCPTSLTVNGQTFTNFEGEAAPTLSLQQAFALSCNTAFIHLAAGLPDGQSLVQAAALYGLGTTVHPGLAVAATRVPTPATANDRAATAIGQAGVLVSPLAMASVAATADSGSYHPPRLVSGAADDKAPAVPLPAGIADSLHTLMASVVSAGTASGLGLPAGTAGKTGTAEFGAGPHPPTHAWFIGYRGDLAFSVFVYGGGVGGPVCAPLAAAMLNALPAGYDAQPAP